MYLSKILVGLVFSRADNFSTQHHRKTITRIDILRYNPKLWEGITPNIKQESKHTVVSTVDINGVGRGTDTPPRSWYGRPEIMA